MRRLPPEHRTLALLCGVMFVTVVDLAVVNTALPSIQRALGASPEALSWVTVGYGLAVGGFLLLGGWTGDRCGHRRAIGIGLAVIAAGSALGGASATFGLLVAGRIVQGLGASLAAPNTLGLLSRTFAEGPERSRALGTIGAAGGVGAIAGSVLGGVLVELLGWRAVFFFNLPVCALLVTAAWLVVPRDRVQTGGGRPDVPGALTLTTGLMAVVLGLHEGGAHGWASAGALGALLAGVALLAAFVTRERRTPAPLIPLAAFRRPGVAGANVAAALLWASFLALIYQATIFTQRALGFTPLEAGLAGLPIAVVSLLVAARLAEPLVTRIGAAATLGGGLALMAAGFAWLTRMPVDARYLSDFLAPYLVLGVGLGLAQVAVQVAAFTGVRPEHAGIAGGLVETSRELGGAVGLAIVLTLAIAQAGDLVGAFHVSTLAAAVLALAGSAVALSVLRRAERVSVAA